MFTTTKTLSVSHQFATIFNTSQEAIRYISLGVFLVDAEYTKRKNTALADTSFNRKPNR